MKRAKLVLAVLILCCLAACAAMTGNQGEGGNKLKKSPCACATNNEGLRHA